MIRRVEPVTLNKYVVEYEQMWKWMVKFFSKFQSRGIKIGRVNLILVAVSNAIVRSWLWLTATRGSPLGCFSTLLQAVDNWTLIRW